MENELLEKLTEEEPVVSLPVVLRRKGEPPKEVEQWVIEEIPVTLFFNGQQMITLLCTGRHLDELAVGFFFAEGWLKERTRLREVSVDEGKGIVNLYYDGFEENIREKFWLKRALTSGCAKGSVLCEVLDSLLERPIDDSLRFRSEIIWELMSKLNRFSDTYKRTHGVHNCALGNGKGQIELTKEGSPLFRYDIGRHNALDMLIGRAFMEDMSLRDKIVVTTGRLTSEIVIKAAQGGVSVLISRHTATRLAIELAGTLNITLIGYVRGPQCIVYCDSGRIMDDQKG